MWWLKGGPRDRRRRWGTWFRLVLSYSGYHLNLQHRVGRKCDENPGMAAIGLGDLGLGRGSYGKNFLNRGGETGDWCTTKK